MKITFILTDVQLDSVSQVANISPETNYYLVPFVIGLVAIVVFWVAIIWTREKPLNPEHDRYKAEDRLGIFTVKPKRKTISTKRFDLGNSRKPSIPREKP